jgi:hypothetical protein
MKEPKFSPVDLTSLMLDGVLMAANEAFFWPLGLALSWEVPKEDMGVKGPAWNLHVREWVYEDGHHECIELPDDDEIGQERRVRFAAWVKARDVRP